MRPKCEVINDINQDLIILYRVLERFYVYFVDMIKFKLGSRAEFMRLLEQSPDTLLDFERAARFIYLQKTAFGGKVFYKGKVYIPFHSFKNVSTYNFINSVF